MTGNDQQRKGRFGHLVCAGVLLLVCGLILAWAFLRLTMFSGEYLDLSERVFEPAALKAEEYQLRIAVATMISPRDTYVNYKSMVEMIGQQAGKKTVLIIRPTYKDVREALTDGSVNLAFVCTGTYALMHKSRKIELLVQPVFPEGVTYHCAIIVPADSQAKSIEDLRGGSFAFTDPESNTGCFIPRYLLLKHGYRPDKFFAKVVYTGSHDRSILAVASGFVDGAAVDSLVLRGLLKDHPELSQKTKVIWRSEAFGPPPVLVPSGLEQALKDSLQQSLLSFHQSEEGRQLLNNIGVLRFELPRPEAYDSILGLYKSYYERLHQKE